MTRTTLPSYPLKQQKQDWPTRKGRENKSNIISSPNLYYILNFLQDLIE
jgi:hypothetical protein